MSTSEIRVLLVDDHPIVRDGLRGQLDSQDDLVVIGEAACAEEALVMLECAAADVLVTDLRMPGRGGLELIGIARERHPSVRVLVLTTFDTEAEISQAIANGAGGYLLKDAGREAICRAVREVARGRRVLAPAVSQRVITAASSREDGPVLTPRESEVLRLVAQGLTNSQVGRALFVGESTVKTHLQHIFAKLDAPDRAAAVSIAHRRGLI